MIIRCERCSTMYELDETLLAPEGSQVQCTKCEHVFVAVPPRSAGRTLVGMPSQPPPAESEGPPAPRPPPPAPPPPKSDAPAGRAPRASSPSVYRPPPSPPPSAPSVGRAPVLKRDTVGAFEARLRWSARWRWLGPSLAAVLVVGASAAWLILRQDGDGAAAQAHAETLALVARDDATSLDEAAARLGDAVRRDPQLKTAAADRALALVMRAAGISDEREALAARLAARTAERERLRAEAPPGWEDAERAAADESASLEAEVRAREEKARALASAAADHLRGLHGQRETPEVLRAFAALHVLRGEREQAQRVLRSGRERGRDPWLDLADGWLDARDPERSSRDRAVAKLGALAAAHPEILRGRYLMARAEASLGRKVEALATVEALLRDNGRHEAAKRLRDELSAPAPVVPPPAPPPVVQVPSPAPRRKSVPQPGAAGSPPPGGAPSAGSPGAAPVSPPPPAGAEGAPGPADAAPRPPADPAAPPQRAAPPLPESTPSEPERVNGG